MSLSEKRKNLRRSFNYLESGDSYVDDWGYILKLEELVFSLRDVLSEVSKKRTESDLDIFFGEH